MSWDAKAERITARAAAQKAAAEADAVRAESGRRDAVAKAEQQRQQGELAETKAAKRRDRRDRRRARLVAVAHGRGLPVLAVGAPALIAWRGQYLFAADTMRLGLLSVLVPIAIEGGVLYGARMTHQAVADETPAGRYRALTWTLAAVAAAMNFTHGDNPNVGAVLGVSSLLSIVQLELTVALRKARQDQKRTGRSLADLRQALVRRVRYPRLSIQAAALAAARGISGEPAWHAAWVDRYGVGPDSSRYQRRIARHILKQIKRADRAAARAGELSLVDGAIVRAAERPATDGEREAAAEHPTGRSAGTERDAVVSGRRDLYAVYAAEGIDDIERWLSDVPAQHDETPELSAGPDERTERSYERSADATGERPANAHGERLNGGAHRERSEGDERPGGAAHDERSLAGVDERLKAVRLLLKKQPGLSGADIATALNIPKSTARRLRARVRRERGER